MKYILKATNTHIVLLLAISFIFSVATGAVAE